MMDDIYEDITKTIGKTPMVRLSKLTTHFGVEGEILAKLEYLNPGFSKKDRVALQMIAEAEQSGALSKGQCVVELTSGNTGTGLAIVCAAKGYPFIAVMSKGNSTERARMMQALGATVILVDQAPGSRHGEVSGEDLALVEQETIRLAEEKGAFRANQFLLEANTRAHECFTAEEMWAQCNGEIDAFVDFMGTGGTFEGCARGLKRHNAKIRCYAVEPATASVYAGACQTNLNHKIQGGGYAMDLPLLDQANIERCLLVSNEEAIQTARALATVEGIFAGFSSGANVAAAISLLRSWEKGNAIALTINDSGLKYLSTDLFC